MSVQVLLTHDAELLAQARAVREQVFVVEQRVPPEIEWDGRDGEAEQVVALIGGRVVGTGRMLDQPRADDPVLADGRIGRMAVLADYRGQGIGAAMLRVLGERAVERGLVGLELHAQVHAQAFYAAHGYTAVGERDHEAGIEHQTMTCELLPGIRDVTDHDAGPLEHLIGSVWSEYPGVLLDVDAEEPWLRAPAAAYAQKGGRFWVLPGPGEAGGQRESAGRPALLGCVGWRPGSGPGVAELKSLYVAAAARRQGWGRRLVRLVERAARVTGAGTVELFSDTRFVDAHRLYAGCGYRRMLARDRDLHDLSDTREWAFIRDPPRA